MARSWYTLALLVLAYIVSMIDRISLTLLVGPIQRDLGISDTEFGLLTGFAFALFYTVIAIPIASLADRRPRRLIIGVGILLWSAMTVACGLARSFWQLFFARMAVGVGEAALGPAGVSLISDLFPRAYIGRALAIFQAGSVLGIGAAYLIGGSLIAAAGQLDDFPMFASLSDWQIVFVLVGLPGVLVAALMATAKEPPRTIAGGQSGLESSESRIMPYLRSNASALVPYFSGYALFQLVSFAFISWVPTLLVRRYGMDIGFAGLSLGLIFVIVSPAGMICAGIFHDYLARRGRVDAPVIVAVIGCAGMCVFGGLTFVPERGMTSLLLLAPFFFLNSLAAGVANVGVQAVTPGPLRARSIAIFSLVINLVGMGLGPVSAALLTDKVFDDRLSVGLSLSAIAAIFSFAALVIFLLGAKRFSAAVARTLNDGRIGEGAPSRASG